MSENGNGVKVVGVMVCGLLFLTFLYVISTVPFPHSVFRSREVLPIRPSDELGAGMSLFLWNFRGIDMLIASILLITTAMSCITLLREEKQ
jgi:multisubunit Na+/H+ antiporter MnhB subunit